MSLAVRIVGVIIFACFLDASSLAYAFDPSVAFDKKCSSCHTIGAGDDVGPDLKGITEKRPREWLIRWIQSSQSLIQAGDPVGVQLFNQYKMRPMPDQELTADEVGALLDYIKSGETSQAAAQVKAVSRATPADVAMGRDLFLGKAPFAHGAPSCVSCHSVADNGPLGGGTLGVNLTEVYSKYEDNGLSKALSKPGFPIMKALFAEKPLSEEEVFALKAFLYGADKAGYQGGDYQKKFIFLGLGGVATLLGATDWIWRKRRKRSAKPWNRGAGA